MNRPEYSLSLDAVICRRCSTVSPIEESHCPSCGADRQGAIFTSNADATAAAPMPAPLDILDLSDSGWLQRLVRRKMLTTYPNFVEPGDLPDAQQRKPARTGIAMLVGSVVASIAAGGYFYSTLDGNIAPPTAEPGISVAGPVHDGAPAAEQARHAASIRPRAESTTAQTVAPASAEVSKASRAPEQQASAARSTIQAAPPPSRTEAQVAPAVSAAPANVPAHDSAPSVAIVVTKPAPVTTTSVAASTGASVVAAAPSIKPAAPVIASAQKTEAREIATPPVAAKPMTQAPTVVSAQKPTPESATPAMAKPVTPAPAAATAQKPEPLAKPVTPAPAAATAQKPEPLAKPMTPAPAVASAQKPEPLAKPMTQSPAIASVQKPEPIAKPMTPAPAIASQQTAAKGKPTTAALEKPAAPAPIAEPLPAAVAHSIAAVQQALASRDLTSARRHMRGLYASLPRSPEIQQLAADLSRQERARDSAMASARSCTANRDAACALRHARRAVALDPRNAQAQSTLRRALAVQNETNTEYFRQASAIPQPTLPAMTFDGRWSAGPRHGATSGSNEASNFTFFGWGVPVISKGRGEAH
ncbi:hypothetical protein AWB74_00657 [Caballeronia arvi]|uniref:Uncharacterized protein n=1 Tax=Caballeronia arvi TaxID=1777135 RepID=A0A158FHJ9_9BURK|nr:hypothetical protein [Caballeronia arvi]SAL19328.1 hypothetical protein AWB74_00657 [Caballeronia arvi]